MAKKFKNRSKDKGAKVKSRDAGSSKMDNTPSFSLAHLRSGYCLTKCNQEERASFANRIHLLSQLKWNDIMQAAKHGLGCETIAPHSIKGDAIPSCLEGKNILAFRFYGKAPMVGFREKGVFHIVWFDRDFSLYNHGS